MARAHKERGLFGVWPFLKETRRASGKRADAVGGGVGVTHRRYGNTHRRINQ